MVYRRLMEDRIVVFSSVKFRFEGGGGCGWEFWADCEFIISIQGSDLVVQLVKLNEFMIY